MTVKRITPTTFDGGLTDDPIFEAYHSDAGVIEMEGGEYPTPRYTDVVTPDLFKGLNDDVVIRRGSQDTLFFNKPQMCDDVTFENVRILCSPRAGVIFGHVPNATRGRRVPRVDVPQLQV